MDYTRDKNGAVLNELSQLYPLPAFVKRAALEQLTPAQTSDTIYADPSLRKFPCHNAASTWLSALYFTEKAATEYTPKRAAEVRSSLHKFGSYWGIAGELNKIEDRWQELHKSADDSLPDSDFAYLYVDELGHKERSLRIKNAKEAKAAAAWLQQYQDQMPFSDRNVVAKKILEKAAAYGADLGEHELFVERQAGRGVCDPKEVVQQIQIRAKLASSDVMRTEIGKLADIVSRQPRFALDPSTLIKLASTLDNIDHNLGLTGKYTETIRPADAVIFKVLYKEAETGVGNAVALTTGRVFDKSAFHKIALNDVRALMGSDFADEISDGLNVDGEKLAAQAAALPLPDAEIFERILTDSGLNPVMDKTAEFSPLAQPRFAKLAASY